jgi:hypothetical protein
VAAPSIKGMAMQSAVVDVARLLEAKRVTPEELEVRLTAADLQLLDDKLNPAAWYPIESYRRFVRLLVDKEAHGRVEEYLMQRGWRAAERIKNTGLYGQLEASRETWGARVGRIVVSIASVLYNFTRWSIELVEEDKPYRVIVDDARAFVDECRYTAQGFVAYASTLVGGGPVDVTSSRPTPDRVVYEVRRARSGGAARRS